MSDSKEKHILFLLDEEAKESFQTIFEAFKANLYSDEAERDSYDYVLTSNLDYTTKAEEEVLVVTSEKAVGCEHSVIQKESLGNEIVIAALKRFFGCDSTINIEDEIGCDNYHSYKITDPFSLGHYSDAIASQLYKNRQDFRTVRKSFGEAARVLLDGYDMLPLEIDLVISDDYQVVQMHTTVKNLESSLNKLDAQLQKTQATLIDFYTLNKSKTLVVMMCWLKDVSSSSYLKHHLPGFSSENKNAKVYQAMSELVNPVNASVSYSGSNEFGTARVRKIATFMRNQKISKGEAFDFNSSLSDYPVDEHVSSLTADDIDFIKKLLKDIKMYDAMEKAVVGGRDDLLDNEDMYKVAGSAMEDVEYYEFSSLFEDEEEAITRIKGTREDISEGTMKVGHWEEEPAEAWKVKRLDVSGKVRKELEKLQATGNYTEKEIDAVVTKVIQEELDLNPEQAQKMKEMILQSMASMNLGQSDRNGAEDVFLRLENQKLKGEIHKKEDQVIRMKRIIDSMKEEFANKVNADKEIACFTEETQNMNADEKVNLMNSRMGHMMENVSRLEMKLEKTKEDYNKQIQEKNYKISELTDHAHEMKLEDGQIERLQAKYDALEREADRMAEQVIEAEKGFQDRVRDIEDKYGVEGGVHSEIEMERLQLQVDELRKKYTALERENDQMAEQVISAEKDFQDRVRDMEEKFQKSVDDVTADPAETGMVFIEKERLEKQLEESRDEVASLKTENEILADQISDVERGFESRMKALRDEVAAKEEKVKEAIEQKEMFEQQLDVMGAQFDDLSRDSGDALDLGDDDNEEIDKLQEELDNLKSEFEEAEEQATKYMQENLVLEHEITELRKELKKYEKKAA